jgi:hypothetical protein
VKKARLAGIDGVHLGIKSEYVIKNWREEMVVKPEHEDSNRLDIEIPERKNI